MYIRELKKNTTYKDIAKLSGVSTALIISISTGRRGIPKPSTLKKLAPALGVSYEELMKKAGYL